MTDESTPTVNYDQMEIQPEVQFLYEWVFNQDEEDADFTINYPPTFNPKSIVFELNKEKDCIKAYIPDMLPIICGKLGGKAKSYTQSLSNTSLTFSIAKESPGNWPLPTVDIHLQESTCDPQTSFNIGSFMIQSPNENSAQAGFEALTRSAIWGYMPAVRIFIKLNLKSENPNLNRLAFELLRKSADYYHIPDMQFTMGVLLSANEEMRESSISYFEMAAQSGIMVARSFIGQLLSPLCNVEFKYKDGEKAVALFESVLKIEPDEQIACSELAKLLYNGVGVELNEERAKELHKIAKEQNQEIPELEKVSLTKKQSITTFDIFAAVFVIGLASAISFSIFKYIQKKRK